MKYTRSRDGVERATLHVTKRVTREEYRWLVERAKAGHVYESAHQLLAGMLTEGWESEKERAREEAVMEHYDRQRERQEAEGTHEFTSPSGSVYCDICGGMKYDHGDDGERESE